MANRTALFSRHQPGGVFTIDDLAEHPGDIWFVDSGSGTDGAGYGRNPDAPFATWDYANNNCTESQGDVIYLMPGHAETITDAGDVTMDVAGINVIGLGHGDARPTITFTTADDASIVVSGSDCLIRNVVFVCNIASQAHMIDLAADNFTIEDCEFKEGSATGKAFITADTADGDSDYCQIRRCLFYAPTAGNYDAAIQVAKDHTNWLIEDCDIYGDFDEAGIDVGEAGNACALLRIYRNRITNLLADNHAIQISGTAVTGWAVGNKLQTNAQATAFDSSALSCHDNTWVDTDGDNDEEAVPANTLHATSTIAVDLMANAVDATAIAADAITAAKIADNAFSEEHFDVDATNHLIFGTRLTKATGSITEAGTIELFEISGGLVAITSLVGEVTETMGADQDTSLQHEAVDIAPLLACDSDAVGTLYGCTGDPSDAVFAAAGTVKGMAQPIIANAGTIEHVVAGNTFAGNVTWRMTYVPLESGASAVAAT